jgi:AraC family transcriptional regulator
MYEWHQQIQAIVDEIDTCIKSYNDEALTLRALARRLGYSEFHTTRKFKEVSGMQLRDYLRRRKLAFASEYRQNPKPVVLRTKINPFDRYLLGLGEIGMMKSTDDVKIYFVTIPAHKFLHIRNYESNGYWDFWEKQSKIPGQDCDTICGLLDSIKGKLDDHGGGEPNSGSGQVMGYINDPQGRLCDWRAPSS